MPQLSDNLSVRLPSREQIAQRAYEIYLNRCGQNGRDKDDWLQAEYELMQIPIREIATHATTSPTGKKQNRKIALQTTALFALVESALVLGARTMH